MSKAPPVDQEAVLDRVRRWIVIAMVVNVFLAGGLALAIELSRTSLSARYEPGFPSDMLMVKNGGEQRLFDVVLEIDGRYLHQVRSLRPGVHGFEVQRAFEDRQENRPAAGYVPRLLKVMHRGGQETIEVVSPGRRARRF